MNPSEEKYSAEIETALYNAMLRQMVQRPTADGHSHGHTHIHSPVSSLPPRPSERSPLPRGTPAQQAAALASQLEADEQTATAAALAADARAPPSPPLCVGGASDCLMVAAAANTYFVGQFYPVAATSLKSCEISCITDAKCVAMTFSARPNDPCELYSSITRSVYQSADTTVAVKCKKADVGKPATTCGHFANTPTPPPGPPRPPPGPALPPGIRCEYSTTSTTSTTSPPFL
jgi:hypothetical protein